MKEQGRYLDNTFLADYLWLAMKKEPRL